MTQRGGLSLSIIIGELEEGGQVSFCLGSKNSLGGPVRNTIINRVQTNQINWCQENNERIYIYICK
jgi:hypothetical protein